MLAQRPVRGDVRNAGSQMLNRHTRVASSAEIAEPCAMAATDIPDDVRRFVLAAIPSVPHLEALLLLRGPPVDSWSPAQLARRLYVDDSTGIRLLDDLRDAGLAVADADGWRYYPSEASLHAVVEQLATVYSRHVIAITELIHSSSERKAHRFADAFRLRKES